MCRCFAFENEIEAANIVSRFWLTTIYYNSSYLWLQFLLSSVSERHQRRNFCASVLQNYVLNIEESSKVYQQNILQQLF